MLNLSILSSAPAHTMAVYCDMGSQNSFLLITLGGKKEDSIFNESRSPRLQYIHAVKSTH